MGELLSNNSGIGCTFTSILKNINHVFNSVLTGFACTCIDVPLAQGGKSKSLLLAVVITSLPV